MTVNTAHAFFRKLCQPLDDVAKGVAAAGEGDGDEELGGIDAGTASNCSELLVSLQLLLMSLASTQGQLSLHDPDEEHRQLFDKLRREWSANLQTQLEAR